MSKVVLQSRNIVFSLLVVVFLLISVPSDARPFWGSEVTNITSHPTNIDGNCFIVITTHSSYYVFGILVSSSSEDELIPTPCPQ